MDDELKILVDCGPFVYICC